MSNVLIDYIMEIIITINQQLLVRQLKTHLYIKVNYL